MIYVGIDPGKHGGIAAIDEHRQVWFHQATPQDDMELLAIFMRLRSDAGTGIVAVLEYVRSSPQMGVVSAFTFGRGYGALRMALAASRISYEEVTPGKWQTQLGCRSQGNKNVTKARAAALFPEVKVTHAVADALLLAEYGRRTIGGMKDDADF